MKRKIAMLSIHSSPLGQPGIGDTGGMSIYIRELTAELARQGHSVDIYTRSQDPTLPEIVELGARARLIHIQSGEQIGLDKLLIYSHAPDVACKIATYCKQNDLHYDAIFSHYWISGIAGLYLKAWWGIPHLVMFHTLGAVKNAIGIGEDEPELRIEEEGLIARDCDRVIASTAREREFLGQYYNVPAEKVKVIPCGVNTRLFRPLDKTKCRQELGLGDQKTILFVGRIERLKGVDRLISALPRLQGMKPKLYVVGEDGNRRGETQRLEALADELGVADSVVFPGLVDHERLPLYYNAADVCVLPSYYESFGLVPLEALACGTPVVATNVGNLRNIVREGRTGYVVENNRPECLAETIGPILSGKAPAMDDKQAISRSIHYLSWQEIASTFVRTLHSLLARQPVKTA